MYMPIKTLKILVSVSNSLEIIERNKGISFKLLHNFKLCVTKEWDGTVNLYVSRQTLSKNAIH